MLALSPATKDGCCDGISSEFLDTEEDFHGGDLLDIIDFDDLFGDHTLLPDLELDSPPPPPHHDHHIFAGDQFSDDHVNASSSSTTTDSQEETNNNDNKGISGKGEEFVSKREDDVAETVSYDGKGDRKRKYSSLSCSSKNNNRIFNNNKNEGKRKVKVDWTAELHRRFVEAVEKLGLEKAVPSRILDLMGVHCLTRHNVASHLQKYRSHRKHLLAREAEAATWTRKRHSLYGLDHNLTRSKTNSSSWFSSSSSPTTTIGFPPPPRVPHVHHQLISTRPLHVWGHPTVIDQSQHNMMMMMMMWPKHLSNNIAMAPTTPPLCLSNSPFWPRIHNGTTPYMPTVVTRYKAPPAAGILHAPPPLHTGYKPDNRFASAPPLVDLHPSKESVDAAIGDVLTRPWLPLPLGLKPPAVEGVMKELHRHGVSDVPPPPTTASCA